MNASRCLECTDSDRRLTLERASRHFRRSFHFQSGVRNINTTTARRFIRLFDLLVCRELGKRWTARLCPVAEDERRRLACHSPSPLRWTKSTLDSHHHAERRLSVAAHCRAVETPDVSDVWPIRMRASEVHMTALQFVYQHWVVTLLFVWAARGLFGEVFTRFLKAVSQAVKDSKPDKDASIKVLQ
jgi:hypothetical protein